MLGGDDNKDDTSDSVLGGDDNKDDTTAGDKDEPKDEPEVLPAKTFTVGEKSFTAEGGKWLYNETVDAANSAKYKMIIFDKNFTGTFATNGWGAVVVVNKYGELIKLYDGANVGYYTTEGKAASAHFNTSNFATTAFAELEDGELMIFFPNDGVNDATSARKFALDLRPNITPGLFGLVTTLTGFEWEVRQPAGGDVVEPNPGETPDAGDNTVVFFALMALSMTAVVVLVSKKRAF